MHKIYIAAPLYAREMAEKLAGMLREDGHSVTSTWHANVGATVDAERAMPADALARTASICVREMRRADAMVVIYDGDGGRAGHIWEAGYFSAVRGWGHLLAMPYKPSSVVPCIFIGQFATRMATIEDVRRVWS